jgi:predicted nucleic acid-binding protein
MRILLDSNVVIDFLEGREPFFEESARVIERVEQGVVTGLLCATTLTTIAYLAGKTIGKKQAVEQVRQLLTLFEVAPVNRSILDAALAANMADFEDAVLAEAAHQSGAQAIITRNLKDFARSPVRAYTPRQWLAIDAA